MRFKSNWHEIRARYDAWWNRTLDGPIVGMISMPSDMATWDSFETARGMDNPQATVAAFKEYCSRVSFDYDSHPSFFVNFGPGIIAAFLGSEVTMLNGTAWHRKDPPIGVGEQIRFDPRSPWYARTMEITREVAASGAAEYLTGPPSHSGSLDLLASLRGAEQLLVDMKTDSGQVSAWMESMTGFWLRFFHEFHAIISEYQEGLTTGMPIWAPGSW